MDYFFIFRHDCLEEANDGRQLNSLDAELLRPGGPYPNEERYTFNNLTQGESFSQAIAEIMKVVHKLALNFTNVQFVSENTELFTSILPQ